CKGTFERESTGENFTSVLSAAIVEECSIEGGRKGEDDLSAGSYYYPGQKFRARMENLKGGQWVHCTKKTQDQRNDLQQNVSLTVTSVEVASVDVLWLYCVGASSISGKKEKLTGDAIKEIRVLDRRLQLGDVRCLTVGDEGIPPVMSLEEWKKATMQELEEGTGREERRNIALKKRGVLTEAAGWSFIRAEEESKVKQSTTEGGSMNTTPAKGLKVGSVGGGKSGKSGGKKGKGAGVNLAQTGGDARGLFQGQEGSSPVGSDGGASESAALSLKPGQKITVEALRVATYVDVLFQEGQEWEKRGKWGKKGKGAGVNLAQTEGDARGLFQVGSDGGASEPAALSLKPGQKITVEALRVATYVDVLFQQAYRIVDSPIEALKALQCVNSTPAQILPYCFFPCPAFGTCRIRNHTHNVQMLPNVSMSCYDRLALPHAASPWNPFPLDSPGHTECPLTFLSRWILRSREVGANVMTSLPATGAEIKFIILFAADAETRVRGRRGCEPGPAERPAPPAGRTIGPPASLEPRLPDHAPPVPLPVSSSSGTCRTAAAQEERAIGAGRAEAPALAKGQVFPPSAALDTPSPLPSQPPPGNSPPSSQEGSSSVGSDSGASDPPALSLKPGQKITVEALRVATYVDVLWQDGTESIAVPSSDLYPGYTFDEHEFFPGTRVLMETSNSDAVNAPQKGMDGIVQWASQADRTAMVRWLPADRPGDAEEDDELSQLIEKEHAVYELKVDEYFHYRYHIGDIVLLLRGGGIIPKCYVLDVRSEMKKLEEQFSPSLSKSCQKGDSDEELSGRIQKESEELEALRFSPGNPLFWESADRVLAQLKRFKDFEYIVNATMVDEETLFNFVGQVSNIRTDGLMEVMFMNGSCHCVDIFSLVRVVDFILKLPHECFMSQDHDSNTSVTTSEADGDRMGDAPPSTPVQETPQATKPSQAAKGLKESSSEHIEDLEESVEQDQSVEYLNAEESVEVFKGALDTLPSESLEEDVESREQEKPHGSRPRPAEGFQGDAHCTRRRRPDEESQPPSTSILFYLLIAFPNAFILISPSIKKGPRSKPRPAEGFRGDTEPRGSITALHPRRRATVTPPRPPDLFSVVLLLIAFYLLTGFPA
ncbi:unnamed protein product, partial [Cyprideis torosa]